MTPECPKGPESEARPEEPSLQQQLSAYIGGWLIGADEQSTPDGVLIETGRRLAQSIVEDALEPEWERLNANLKVHRERDTLTRKALQTEEDWPLQFLALRVRQERDKGKAEVSRLREQLAAQQPVWAPADPTDESARLASALRFVGVVDPDDDCMSVFDTTGEGIKHWVPVDAIALRMLEHGWGVSSSEVEAPQPQPLQHKVQIKRVFPGTWAAWCPDCRVGGLGTEEETRDWQDGHEADTLRLEPLEHDPEESVRAFLVDALNDEGRPSGSGAAAPHSGVGLIAAERARQVAVEGWTPDQDAEYQSGELVRAASCYLTPPEQRQMMLLDQGRPVGWPWESSWWKPSDDRVRELVKAGALIAAEIDRLQAQDAAQAARSEATPHPDQALLLAKIAELQAHGPVQYASEEDPPPSPSLRKEGEDSDCD